MIAIWGANSFIGRHLVHTLIGQKCSARLLARDFSDMPFDLPAYMDCIEADFKQPASYIEALRGCKTLVLLVSASRAATFADQPERERSENITPYRTLLQTIEDAGIIPDHIIYASSGGTVYGITPAIPTTEDAPLAPISPYGQAKVEIEQYIYDFAARTGIGADILRIANPIGEWNKRPGLVDAAIKAAKTGPPLTLWGDGTYVRDYFDVRELAGCFSELIAHGGHGARYYNVGSGIGHSINDIIEIVGEVTGRIVPVSRHPVQKADVPYSVLSCSSIYKDIGWRAKTPIAEVIQRMVVSI